MIKIATPQRKFCDNFETKDNDTSSEVLMVMKSMRKIACFIVEDLTISSFVGGYIHGIPRGRNAKVVQIPYLNLWVMFHAFTQLVHDEKYNTIILGDPTPMQVEIYVSVKNENGEVIRVESKNINVDVFIPYAISRDSVYKFNILQGEELLREAPEPSDKHGSDIELKLVDELILTEDDYYNVLENNVINENPLLYNVRGYIIDSTLDDIQYEIGAIHNYQLVPSQRHSVFSVVPTGELYEIYLGNGQDFRLDSQGIKDFLRDREYVQNLRELVANKVYSIRIFIDEDDPTKSFAQEFVRDNRQRPSVSPRKHRNFDNSSLREETLVRRTWTDRPDKEALWQKLSVEQRNKMAEIFKRKHRRK